MNGITKAAKVEAVKIDEKELELINKFTLEPLTSEKVYVFKVAICGNEVDRANEVFPLESLEKMKDLFVGKTMVKDHNEKTDNQVARIYKTEIVNGEGTTKNGEQYSQLIAYCYMVKTDSNADLITEIQAGIKKEVSVCFSVEKAVCSICGTDNHEAYCKHFPGREYDGKECYFKLLDPCDAYEVSFVAIPCQPDAGVTKSKSYKGEEFKETPEQKNTDTEDLVKARLRLAKSFIFVENQN